MTLYNKLRERYSNYLDQNTREVAQYKALLEYADRISGDNPETEALMNRAIDILFVENVYSNPEDEIEYWKKLP